MKYIVITRMYVNGLAIEHFDRQLLDIGEATDAIDYVKQKCANAGIGVDCMLAPVKSA